MSRKLLHRIGGPALLCLLPLLACDSDTSAPGLQGAARIKLPTEKLELFEGDTVKLDVAVVDAKGAPIEGSSVQLVSADTSVAQATSGTVFALNPGSTSVQARYSGLMALLELLVRPSATAIQVIGGNGQTAAVGTQLPQELRVKVVDRRGEGVGGVTVEFVVKQGGGRVSTARILTASNGEAGTKWTLGSTAGEQLVEARAAVSGSVRYSLTPVTFRATATTGTTPPPATPVATRVAISPDSAVLKAIGETATFSATVYDQSGNRMSGQTVSWSSLNSGVASVSSSGVVRAVAVGTARIVARVSGIADTVSVRVAAPQAAPQLIIAPAADTLTALGASRRFTATARDANGASVAVSGLTWTSLNRTIAEVDGSGNVVARGVGTALIVAAAAGFTPDTATVLVRQLAATVTLSGAQSSMQVGQSVQLSATVRDANNNAISGASVSWSTSNSAVATVSSAGLVRAVAEGSATITASSGGKSASTSVRVETVTPPPTEPPPSGSTSWANEPAGFRLIEDRDWANGWGSWSTLWNSNGRMSIVSASGTPFGSSRVLQQLHPAGLAGGGDGTAEANFNIPSSQRGQELYVGVWVRVNPEWDGHSSGINKFLWVSPDGTVSPLWLEMYGQNSNPLRLYVVDQMPGGCGSGVNPNVTTSNFVRGKWHKVEMYLKFGSSTSERTTLKVWVDGVLNINRTDLCTPSTSQKSISTVRLSPIWGGVGDSKATNDFMQWGPIRVSGR